MATTEREAKRFGLSVRDGIIAVDVGPEHTKYFIHKALLVEHSEYFQKALSGPWKEAEDKSVRLDDVDCDSFEVYVNWLYCRKLPAKTAEWIEEYHAGRVHKQIAAQVARLKACALAHRLLSSAFRRATEIDFVDFLISGSPEAYSFYAPIHYAFTHLPSSSSVLQTIVDVFCKSFNPEFDDVEVEDEENKKTLFEDVALRANLPTTFLVGTMLRYAKTREDKNITLERCDYHGHATKAERDTCQKMFSGSDSKAFEDESEYESEDEYEDDSDW